MIEPLEAVLNLCKAHTALNNVTGGRIDDRHHYGQDTGDWALDAQSLTLMPTGGLAYIDGHVHVFQIDARCHGDTYFEAGEVYRQLRDLTKRVRRSVATNSGADLALVYYLVIRGNLRRILDEEIRPNGGMPGYQVILEASVAEEAVTV